MKRTVHRVFLRDKIQNEKILRSMGLTDVASKISKLKKLYPLVEPRTASEERFSNVVVSREPPLLAGGPRLIVVQARPDDRARTPLLPYATELPTT
ncbi:hypothetical protein EVAR_45679_1 [Eumeta japonica]|uniref:Uncharacterized protein n=1 Tax=Eumeta variegata TaxID=151549 RepID=A0A4C1XMK7_EUMVA|nr:hypothetical protein EVAR_45679_1 [Eumeta japonica]